jgi:protein-S-isoprenylcysteine O-methyltransferase Ste14
MFNIAITILVVCTIIFLSIIALNTDNRLSEPISRQVRPLSWIVGFATEIIAYLIVLVAHFTGFAANPSIGKMILAVLLAIISPIIASLAMKQMKGQFTMQAGLVQEHQLITTGIYAMVRHPFYASILCIFLSTAFLLINWQIFLPTCSIFIIGTELRVRSEDAILEQYFGDVFVSYRNRVAAYIPFIR